MERVILITLGKIRFAIRFFTSSYIRELGLLYFVLAVFEEDGSCNYSSIDDDVRLHISHGCDESIVLVTSFKGLTNQEVILNLVFRGMTKSTSRVVCWRTLSTEL